MPIVFPDPYKKFFWTREDGSGTWEPPKPKENYYHPEPGYKHWDHVAIGEVTKGKFSTPYDLGKTYTLTRVPNDSVI